MVNRLLNTVLAWIPITALYSLVYYLSDQSYLPGPEGYVADFAWFKTAHVLVYASIGLFSLLAVSRLFSRASRSRNKLLILYLSLLLSVCLAGHDEWHQSTTPGREAAVRDLVIDSLAIGAMLAWLARYNFRAVSSRGRHFLRDVAQMARAHAWGA